MPAATVSPRWDAPRLTDPSVRDRLLVALLAIAVCAIGIGNDFVYDDIPIIVENTRIHDLTAWRDILFRPYWPPPFVENLYRPVAVASLAVEYAIGGGRPIVFRLVSGILYAAGCVGVLRLAARLVPRIAALAAALLFAVHPVHVEAVALGVNQGELIVGLIATTMLCIYLDRRRAGDLRASDWVLLVGLYALAVLTKEHAFVLPALLLVTELVLVTGEPLRVRARRLAPGFSAMALVAVLLLALRSAVLGGRLAGATPHIDIRGLDLGGRSLAMLQVVPEWFRLLAWPHRLQVDFPPGTFAVPTALGVPEYLGVLLVIAAVAVMVRARRSAPVVSFGLGITAVALLPVSNLLPTGVMLAERTLYLPSIGFVLAVVASASSVPGVLRPPSLRARRALVVLLTLCIILGFVRSADRLSVWNTAHLRVVGPSAAADRP